MDTGRGEGFVQVDLKKNTLEFQPGNKRDVKTGATAGAIIGAAAGGPAGAVVGAAVGAATGYVFGGGDKREKNSIKW